MKGHVRRRLLNWLRWHTSLRSKLRRDLYLHNPGCVLVGDRVTVFDDSGRPHLAEILRIDQWGSARLLREDGVEIERVLA